MDDLEVPPGNLSLPQLGQGTGLQAEATGGDLQRGLVEAEELSIASRRIASNCGVQKSGNTRTLDFGYGRLSMCRIQSLICDICDI